MLNFFAQMAVVGRTALAMFACLGLWSVEAVSEQDDQSKAAQRIFALSFADENPEAEISRGLGYPENRGRKIQFAQVEGCAAVLKRQLYVAEGLYDAEVTSFDLPVTRIRDPKQSRFVETDWVIVFEFANWATRRTLQKRVSPNWEEEWGQSIAGMEELAFDFPSIGFAIKNDDGSRATEFVVALQRYQERYCSKVTPS